MKKTITLIVVIAFLVGLYYFSKARVEQSRLTNPSTAANTETQPNTNTEQENNPVTVTPVTHATAILEWSGSTIYLDPTGTSTVFASKPANITLITDIHGDHLSTSTLNRVLGSSTLIVPQAVRNLLPKNLADRAKVLPNDGTLIEQGFSITAVPMYNTPDVKDNRHVKGRGNGYIIEKDGTRVYVAGDTDATPEMRALTDIDMAFVPMNPPFTMDVAEAAEGVLAFKPRLVYPFHYRGQNGLSDVNQFKQLIDAANAGIEVRLLNWYP